MNGQNTYGSHQTANIIDNEFSYQDLLYLEKYFNSDEYFRSFECLIGAISGNNLKEVKQCIKYGVDLSDEYGINALNRAFDIGSAQIVKELLDASNIDILKLNRTTENGANNPLYVEATYHNNCELMKAVFPLKQYATPSDDDFFVFKSTDLNHALLGSFRNLNIDSIKYLLENGADIDRFNMGLFCQILSKDNVICNKKKSQKAIQLLKFLISFKSQNWLYETFTSSYSRSKQESVLHYCENQKVFQFLAKTIVETEIKSDTDHPIAFNIFFKSQLYSRKFAKSILRFLTNFNYSVVKQYLLKANTSKREILNHKAPSLPIDICESCSNLYDLICEITKEEIGSIEGSYQNGKLDLEFKKSPCVPITADRLHGIKTKVRRSVNAISKCGVEEASVASANDGYFDLFNIFLSAGVPLSLIDAKSNNVLHAMFSKTTKDYYLKYSLKNILTGLISKDSDWFYSALYAKNGDDKTPLEIAYANADIVRINMYPNSGGFFETINSLIVAVDMRRQIEQHKAVMPVQATERSKKRIEIL